MRIGNIIQYVGQLPNNLNQKPDFSYLVIDVGMMPITGGMLDSWIAIGPNEAKVFIPKHGEHYWKVIG